MKIRELKEVINNYNGDLDEGVKVSISVPSIGPTPTVEIESARFGFDWDKGLIINTKEEIVVKEDRQKIFESAYDLLMRLATESFVLNKPRMENLKSLRILVRNGVSEKDILRYVRLFHEGRPIIHTPENLTKNHK